ncbi:MAG: hypothetical protein IJE95_07575, partial [Methanocorpusculum sp.]|nr:hypothetical protein [Methanocorpusculum sp.]
IKEGVGEKASAPQSAGETSAISRSEPRTKEQSYFRSPTETPLKEHQPKKPKLTESSQNTSPDCPPRLGRVD